MDINKDKIVSKAVTKKETAASTLNNEGIKRKMGGAEISQHLINIREILQWSNATPIRSHNGIGYTCCFCDEKYPDPADLKKHTKAVHLDISKASFNRKRNLIAFSVKVDITALQCNICNKSIETTEELINHLKSDHNKRVFTDIKHHIMPFKFNNETLQCFICSKNFHKFKLLVEHMNFHYRNFVCDLCDMGFINRRRLYSHVQGHKTGTFNCDLCPKVFDTLIKKKSHIKYVHKQSKFLNRCGYCNETFRDYRQKERHLSEIHQIEALVLKCNACDRTFKTQRAFRVHTKRDHLMERRHKCQLCERNFFTTNELKEHMIRHTGKREFQCKICLKYYGRKYTLREHMRIHADDRRFKCEHCGQAFVQRCSWRSHMRSKHGEET